MRIQFSLMAVIFSVLASSLPARSVSAAFTFSVEQVGVSVVITGSGTINTLGLTSSRSGGGSEVIYPSLGLFSAGQGGLCTAYGTISGPAQLGPGNSPIPASTASGDYVGVSDGVTLAVPYGYVSGSRLSDTETYFEQTIAYLGLTPGVYNYTWGSGATADSLTINIGTPVPEPASVAVAAIPTLALLRRRRRVSRRA